MSQINIDNKPGQNPVEVFVFMRGLERATIATNGVRSVAQIGPNCFEFERITKAMAFLSAKGYNIVIDECRSV